MLRHLAEGTSYPTKRGEPPLVIKRESLNRRRAWPAHEVTQLGACRVGTRGVGYGRVYGKELKGLPLHEEPLSYFLICNIACLNLLHVFIYIHLCFLYALRAALICTPCELALLAWGVILVVMLFWRLADYRGPSGICVYRARGKATLGTSSFPQVACDCSKFILLSVS